MSLPHGKSTGFPTERRASGGAMPHVYVPVQPPAMPLNRQLDPQTSHSAGPTDTLGHVEENLRGGRNRYTSR